MSHLEGDVMHGMLELMAKYPGGPMGAPLSKLKSLHALMVEQLDHEEGESRAKLEAGIAFTADAIKEKENT